MKTIYKVLFGAVLAVSLASCSHKQTFETASFACFNDIAYVVNEDAGVFRIPVNSFNNTGKTGSVTFKVTDGKAVQGTDYTIEPASGVLTFDGNGTQFIEVAPIAHLGELTGNLDFTIDMVGASGIDLGAATSLGITIKDVDHPLTDLFGAYTIKAITYASGLGYPGWTLNISAYEGDLTRVWLDNLIPFAAAYSAYLAGKTPAVYGIVSDDKKTITIPLPQTTPAKFTAWGIDDYAIMYSHTGFTGSGLGVYVTDDAQAVFTLDEATGAWTTTDSYGISHPSDLPDYPSLFTSYCIVISNYSASYPTYFVKN